LWTLNPAGAGFAVVGVVRVPPTVNVTVAGAVRNTAAHTSSLTGVDPRTVCHFVCPMVPLNVVPVEGWIRCAR
jgi:hypothetical protein